MEPVLVALLLVLLAIASFRLVTKKPNNFPNGPPAIPILGSLPFLPHVPGFIVHCAEEFVAKYGKVMGLYLGSTPAVVIYDYNIAKELFAKEGLAGRPDNFAYRFRMLGNRLGLLFNDGASWKSHRRFSLKSLKDFGFGKKSLESVLLEEADRMVEFFVDKKTEPVYVQTLFNLAIVNILWQIVADKRYELTDPKAQKALQVVTESVQVENLRFLFLFPWIRHFLPEVTGWNKQKESIGGVHSLVKEIVEEHKSTFDENNLRDFIDVYLKEINEGNDSDFNENQLIVTAMDLFTAGSETTSTTLSWAVLYMILYPECQAKVHAEIDQVIGPNRYPSLDDRGKLPYTEACINEIQRLGSIAPMAVPHRALEEVRTKDFTIPKGSLVFSVVRYIMRDPNYWDDPDTFKPERFLDEGGQKVKHEERMVQFGIGKRVCLGEALAKTELFIVFVRLMQKLVFTESKKHPKPTDEPVKGFICSPHPYYTVANLR